MPCDKCNDTGWHQYDHNHSTVCNKCCKHDEGFWLLTKHYTDAGKWCCLKGCGTTWTYKEIIKKLSTNDYKSIVMKKKD